MPAPDPLDPYSRFIGRNPDKKELALESVLLLPPTYWPVPRRTELNDIKAQVRDGCGWTASANSPAD